MADPKWLGKPEEKDYAAAHSYLSLLLAPDPLREALALLRQAPEGAWRAKDILRAAGLPLLKRKQSSEVAEKLNHIASGIAISPILLLHDGRGRLEIADGYHRACAACIVNEDTRVPGRLALLRNLTWWSPSALVQPSAPGSPRRSAPQVGEDAAEGEDGDD
jgi:hypothetical protein